MKARFLFVCCLVSNHALAGWTVPFNPHDTQGIGDLIPSMRTLSWMLISVCTFVSVIFFIFAGTCARDEDYEGSLRAFLAAALAAAAPYIAESMKLS